MLGRVLSHGAGQQHIGSTQPITLMEPGPLLPKHPHPVPISSPSTPIRVAPLPPSPPLPAFDTSSISKGRLAGEKQSPNPLASRRQTRPLSLSLSFQVELLKPGQTRLGCWCWPRRAAGLPGPLTRITLTKQPRAAAW